MSKREIERLEEMVANLEAAAGLNPKHEVIRQREDGTWPEPTTSAELIFERCRFPPDPVVVVNQRRNEAALVTDVEAHERLHKSPIGRHLQQRAK